MEKQTTRRGHLPPVRIAIFKTAEGWDCSSAVQCLSSTYKALVSFSSAVGAERGRGIEDSKKGPCTHWLEMQVGAAIVQNTMQFLLGMYPKEMRLSPHNKGV